MKGIAELQARSIKLLGAARAELEGFKKEAAAALEAAGAEARAELQAFKELADAALRAARAEGVAEARAEARAEFEEPAESAVEASVEVRDRGAPVECPGRKGNNS